MSDAPKILGYRMPAEWEPHEGTWLSWPHNPRTWQGNFGPIPAVFVEIVRALCPGENVHICVRDLPSEVSVRQMLLENGLDSAGISFHHVPTNDAWARDHGPMFVRRDAPAQHLPLLDEPAVAGETPALRTAGAQTDVLCTGGVSPAPAGAQTDANKPWPRLAIVDWKFNAWGGKYPPWDDDAAVASRVAEGLGLPCFQPRMILEGGGIDVNGLGTLLTTECVLLNPNRNPQLTARQVEARLDCYLAAHNVVWLGQGIAGDDTDGHIDDIARFVNPTTVLAAREDDPHDVNYNALHENFERLQSACDQDGQKLEIVALPMPGKIFRTWTGGGGHTGERLPASYANFYIANRAVLVPVFGTENDERAKGLIGEFFPGRQVVGIRCNDLVGGYGAIHCVTQQQPA